MQNKLQLEPAWGNVLLSKVIKPRADPSRVELKANKARNVFDLFLAALLEISNADAVIIVFFCSFFDGSAAEA